MGLQQEISIICDIIAIAIAVYSLKRISNIEDRTKKYVIIFAGIGVILGIFLQIESLYMEDFSILVGTMVSLLGSTIMLTKIRNEKNEDL